MTSRIRVLKVGGSLLTRQDLPSRLGAWLAEQTTAATVMIAGGGPWVELLRQAAKRFGLDEVPAHVMCLQAMSVTANLLAELGACPCTKSLAELQYFAERSCRVVFDVQDWLLHDTTTEDLPKSWAVTSDSIAARLAVVLAADELVLLKSCAPTSSDLQTLADDNYVDDFFPTAASNVPLIRYENLR